MNIARKHSSQDKICQVQGEFPYFLSSNVFKLIIMLLCIGDVRSRRHHGHLQPSIDRSAAPAPGGRGEPQLGAAAGPHHRGLPVPAPGQRVRDRLHPVQDQRRGLRHHALRDRQAGLRGGRSSAA